MKLWLDGDRIRGVALTQEDIGPEYDWINLPAEWTDGYGNLLYRWDGEKPVLDPIDPDPQVKEAKRVEKVKAKFNAELFSLVYANKDDPGALSAAMCDRMKEIDAEIKIEETTKEKTS